jgi:multicomponent Na+:H+ antiporter subunit A
MLLAVLSGFIIACVLVFTGKLVKTRLSFLLALLPASLFVYFLGTLPNVAEGKTSFYSYKWIPALGINLDFFLDGLSLLFCLLITGIGSLVFLYASAYLKGHKYLDRFFGYLSLFHGFHARAGIIRQCHYTFYILGIDQHQLFFSDWF